MARSDDGSQAGRRPSNRLSQELSPYLRLHAHNPVDWYPWGREALARARDEDKPIFLSVGYATCYWCHVMERESFSDAGTAKLMNEHFVNIKVDREERPELDEIYMAATQIFAQQGGWPNSVFLTPDLRPFFAGTYFPPTDLHGRPSFKTVLLSMHNAWQSRREDVFLQAEDLADAMRRMLEERGGPGEAVPGAAAAEKSRDSLLSRYDEEWGGFGNTPKFPTPANLFLLLDLAEDGDEKAAEIVEHTLDQMAQGGIYDQLAGGFHRYATDRRWKVPHFEKMLYDNGLLLEVYGRDFARTGNEERRRILLETAEFLERELTSPEGAFWSAIDAEVAGKEGAYHVWTLEEIVEVLGEEDAGFLAPILGFDGPPFFEGESYVLHLPESLAEQASRRRQSIGDLVRQVKGLEARLLEAREKRKKPLVDDKILTDWNGMAIAGLATAAMYLSDDHLLAQARNAANFVLENLRLDPANSGDGADSSQEEPGAETASLPQASLRHSWRAGEGRFSAYLSDYVFFVHGLLALHDADGDERWLQRAIELTEEQCRRLEDGENGGFFVAGESSDILFRSKEVFDGALPSANGMAALVLLELAERDERQRWLPIAERTLKAFAVAAEHQAEGARVLNMAVRRYHRLLRTPDAEQAAQATVLNLVEKAAQAIVRPRLILEPAEAEAPAGKTAGKTSGETAEDGEESRPFRLELRIKDGWHVYAHEPGDDNLTATGLEGLEGVEGSLSDLFYPPGEAIGSEMKSAGTSLAEAVQIYHGTVVITGRLRGGSAVYLTFQPCDDRRCLPTTRIRVEAEEPTTH